MRNIFLLLLLFISGYTSGQENEVVLYGKSQGHANYNFIVEHTQNFITKEKTELKRFKVDKHGDFSVSFNVTDITKITIKLGTLEGFLYVKPGNKYEVLLPPFIPLKTEDQLNPFFIPEEVNIGILNTDPENINRNIQEFDSHFQALVNKNIKRIVIANDNKRIDAIISETDSLFPTAHNTWFYAYKNYAYQSLRSLNHQNNLRVNTNEFSKTQHIPYQHPTFWNIFNQTYKNFFYQYFNSDEGDILKESISNKNDFSTLTKSLQKDTIFSKRNLSELVLLKAIYDAYYSKNYTKQYLISLVKDASSLCSSEENRLIASSIYTKITKLTLGSKAPNFDLPNMKGKMKNLDKYKGKFVYLNFASTNNYACKKDFQVLQTMEKVYAKDLHIVTVLCDQEEAKAIDFVKKNKLDWNILLFSQNGKILYDYNVKAYPTYYLIDPEGNIALAPAPAPEEEFSSKFAEIFNNYRHQQLRKNKPKERTIYDL